MRDPLLAEIEDGEHDRSLDEIVKACQHRKETQMKVVEYGSGRAEVPAAYDPEAFAKKLGVGRSTIYAMIAQGELKSVKIGRRRLIPATEIQRLLDQAK